MHESATGSVFASAQDPGGRVIVARSPSSARWRVWIALAVALLSLPLTSCTFVGLGIGGAADARREPRHLPPSAINSVDEGEWVTVVTHEGRKIEGQCYRRPPNITLMHEGDASDELEEVDIREVQVPRPPEAMWIGGGIGLAVDVTVLVIAKMIDFPNFKQDGGRWGG